MIDDDFDYAYFAPGDFNHVRHALRTLDASIDELIKQGEELRVSLQVVGVQMDNVVNQAKK